MISASMPSGFKRSGIRNIAFVVVVNAGAQLHLAKGLAKRCPGNQGGAPPALRRRARYDDGVSNAGFRVMKVQQRSAMFVPWPRHRAMQLQGHRAA